MKKLVYLFLALLLPGLIYVFLKFFGKNQFDVPVYYENGVDTTACDFSYPVPYVVPDSLMQLWQQKPGLLIFVTGQDAAMAKNLERLKEEFGAGEFTVIVLDSTQQLIRKCILLLQAPWTVVAVDEENRIRGYYAPSTLEEADRLILEMRILLKKY